MVLWTLRTARCEIHLRYLLPDQKIRAWAVHGLRLGWVCAVVLARGSHPPLDEAVVDQSPHQPEPGIPTPAANGWPRRRRRSCRFAS